LVAAAADRERSGAGAHTAGWPGWKTVYTRQALKDARKLSAAGLKAKAEYLLAILRDDPFRSPPPFEKLVGDLTGAYSRRINVQHRLVYQTYEAERVVKVIRLWTHYG